MLSFFRSFAGNLTLRKLKRTAHSGFTATICLVVALQPMMVELANAQQVIIDPNGNVGFKPTIQSTTRSQVVDIAKPNAGGVSHNKYTKFTTTSSGVVLNNATTATNSTLAGTIAGNANLGGQAATTIVNEVTSTTASSLAGAVEVAGARAGVIVANPNGVACNGCNFINAGSITLTTGVPVVTGSTVRLDVAKGAVTIGRGGLNGAANGVGTVNLVGRTVVVDGKITAIDGINIQGGAQSFDLTTGQRVGAMAATGTAPTYAIDGTEFGAMEAGRIQIIGTETGLGVRTLGAIQSNVGNVDVANAGSARVRSVAARGKAELRANAGTLTIERDITSATQNVIAFGSIGIDTDVRSGLYGATGVAVSGGALSFQGVLQSTNQIDLTANGALTFGAYGTTGGTFTLSSGAAIAIKDATIVAKNLTANSASATTTVKDSAIFASGNVTFNTRDFDLGSDVVIDGLTSTTDPLLTLNASGTFFNAADLRAYTRATFRYSNLVNAQTGVVSAAALSMSPTGTITNSGLLLGTTSLAISAQSLTNTASGLISSGTGAANFTIANAFINRGQIVSNGSAVVNAGSVTNEGLIQGIRVTANAASITTGAKSETRGRDAVALTATGAISTNGLVTSEGTLTLSAGALSNVGWMAASSTLSMVASTIVNKGTVTSGTLVRLQSLARARNEGEIVSYAAMQLTAGTQFDNLGTLIADSSLTLSGPIFSNAGTNALVQAKTGALNADKIYNSGRVFLIDSFTRAGNIDRFDNTGIFATQGSISLTGRDASSIFTLGSNGVLIAGLQPGNESQDLLAGKSVAATFATMTVAGSVQAGGNISLTKPTGTLTITGELTSGANLFVKADAISIGAAGLLRAEGYGMFTTPGVLTSAGRMAFADRIITTGGITGFTNSGTVYSDRTQLAAMTGTFSNSGLFQTENATTIVAQNILNAGLIQAGTTAALYARQTMGTDAVGAPIYQMGALSSTGTLTTKGTLTLVGGTVTTGVDAYIAAGRMNVTADAFTNRANAVLDGAIASSWVVKNTLVTSGKVYSQASLSLLATTLSLESTGLLGSGANLNLVASGNAYLNGTASALNIAGTAADISLGTLSSFIATTDLRLTATNGRVLAIGELAAGDDLAIRGTTFDLAGNAYGKQVSVIGATNGVTRTSVFGSNTTNIAVTAGRYSNLGEVEARNKLTITASEVSLGSTSRLAATDIDAISTKWISNAGEVFGANSSLLKAGTSITNATTGNINGVSTALNATTLTNNGLISTYGIAATISDLLTNTGTMTARTYAGLQSGRFTNTATGSITSLDHLYLSTDGLAQNADNGLLKGKTIDMRVGRLYNAGDIRVTTTLNVSALAAEISNAATGTIYGDRLYFDAATSFANQGVIGTTATSLVSADAATTLSNAGTIYGKDINLESGTSAYNTGLISGSGLVQLKAGSSIVQQGNIRSANLNLIAEAVIYNDGDTRATGTAVLEAGSIQNRNISGVRGALSGNILVLRAENGIINAGAMTGVTELGLSTVNGSVTNTDTGTLAGRSITLVSTLGGVWLDNAIAAGDSLVVEAKNITALKTLAAPNVVSLKSTQYDISAYSNIASKKVLIDAARDIKANAGVFRGTELTQLVANDILRLTPTQVTPTSSVSTSSTVGTQVTDTGVNTALGGRYLQYIASYGDLRAAFGANAWSGLNHYNRYGASEGRVVSFDGLAYIASYGDLINAYGANAESGAMHYIRWGATEGRKITFNAEQYLRNYPDLRAAYGADLTAATLHFIRSGRNEGRTSAAISGAMSVASWDAYQAARPNAAVQNWMSAETTTTTTTTVKTSEFNTIDGKLEVVGGTLKDLYIQLRTGSFGTAGTDDQTTLVERIVNVQTTLPSQAWLGAALRTESMSDTTTTSVLDGGATVWNTYERAAINASGNVSLVATAGDIMLTGSIRAGGDISIVAGDRTGLRNIALNAADVLHVEGRGNVLRYGGVGMTVGGTLEVSTGADLKLSTWVTTQDMTYDVSLSGRDIFVDRSVQSPANSLQLIASRDISQTNEVVTARKIAYQAGRNIRIDFNPFEWRSENPNATPTDVWWDAETLGKNGYTLASGVGGMTLYAGNNINLTSGKLYSSRALGITAGNNIISEPFYLENDLNSRPAAVGWAFDAGYTGLVAGHTASKADLYELRAYENQIRAYGDVTISATNAITLIGSQITSDTGDVTISALNGGVTMISAPGQWIYAYDSVRTWRSGWFGVVKNTETYEYDALKDLYKPTTIKAVNGDIVVQASGTTAAAKILTAGTQFNAQNVKLYTPNGDITAGVYRQRNELKIETHRSSKLFGFIGFGSASGTTINNSLINYGNNFLADDNLDLLAPSGTISITGGTLRGRQINITAARLEIIAAINTYRTEYNSRRDNMITITTITSGRIRETADIPQIFSPVPVNFNISGTTTIRGATGIDLNSELINQVGTRQFADTTLGLIAPSAQGAAATTGSTVDRSYNFAYTLPGASAGAQFTYLDQLMRDPRTTYTSFDLRDQQWYDKQVQLNPAFRALLTAVATYMTGGLAGGLGIGNTFIAAGVNSAASNLIVGVVSGTITGDFDMGQVLRGALLAGVTSAVSGYLTSNINLGGYNDLTPGLNTLDDLITPSAIVDRLSDRVISSVVSNVIAGQDPFAGLDSLGRSFLISEVMALSQFGIGELGQGFDGQWEGSVGHMILHGGVGCVAMAAMQGNCTAGFFSGVGQSILTGMSGLTDQQKRELMPLLGAVIGYSLSNGNATNVTFGGTIAQSGFVNNYLSHPQWLAMGRAVAACSGNAACMRGVLSTYRNISMEQEHAMALCGSNLICLAPHLVALSETINNAEVSQIVNSLNASGFGGDAIQQNYWQQIMAVQETSLIATGLIPNRLNGSYTYAYSQYADWAAQNCANRSGIDCMAIFQESEVHTLWGMVHMYLSGTSAVRMYSLALGGAAVASVAPGAIAAVARCAMNPACLADLIPAAGEIALGVTGATAGQTFVTVTVGTVGALSGRIVLSHGDEIIGVMDDAARTVYRILDISQEGRVIFEVPTGGIGIIDAAGTTIVSGATRIPGFSGGYLVSEFSYVNPGPLSATTAGNFAGSRYAQVILDQDIVLYRAGTANQPLGQYFTQTRPAGVVQSRIDSAILPQWPGQPANVIDTVFEVRIPAGTSVYVGEVSAQGGFYVGGTQQIMIPTPWEIPGVTVIGSAPLP